jgi:putative zinc finger/helix-turn-helix YgiT family protein
MNNLCINCGKADVRPDTVRLSGVVRSIPYQVEMQGLKCRNCGHSTLDAKGMTEFSRLLSDKYRAAHDLLTSEEILSLRNKFNESQEQFAKRCHIGIATLKRIEKGKIQDSDTDRRIRENTKVTVKVVTQYVVTSVENTGTMNNFGSWTISVPSGIHSVGTAAIVTGSTRENRPASSNDFGFCHQESIKGCSSNATEQWMLGPHRPSATSLEFFPIITRGPNARS